MEKFGLRQCLAALREDLSAVKSEGAGSAIGFAIDRVDLEFTIVAGDEAAVEGGVKWYVLSAGVEAKTSQLATQKLSMSLSVVDPDTGKPTNIGAKRPAKRPGLSE